MESKILFIFPLPFTLIIFSSWWLTPKGKWF